MNIYKRMLELLGMPQCEHQYINLPLTDAVRIGMNWEWIQLRECKLCHKLDTVFTLVTEEEMKDALWALAMSRVTQTADKIIEQTESHS